MPNLSARCATPKKATSLRKRLAALSLSRSHTHKIKPGKQATTSSVFRDCRNPQKSILIAFCQLFDSDMARFDGILIAARVMMPSKKLGAP